MCEELHQENEGEQSGTASINTELALIVEIAA